MVRHLPAEITLLVGEIKHVIKQHGARVVVALLLVLQLSMKAQVTLPQDPTSSSVSAGVKVLIVILLCAAVIGAAFWYRYSHSSPKSTASTPNPTSTQQPTESGITNTSAYNKSVDRAQQWHNDAVLAYFESGTTGLTESHADSWSFIFTSPSVKDVGLKVTTDIKGVISAKEIPYVGSGATFPKQALTQEEAISRLHAMDAYRTARISHIEAVYSPAVKTWYWGITTDKGVVSIKATP